MFHVHEYSPIRTQEEGCSSVGDGTGMGLLDMVFFSRMLSNKSSRRKEDGCSKVEDGTGDMVVGGRVLIIIRYFFFSRYKLRPFIKTTASAKCLL